MTCFSAKGVRRVSPFTVPKLMVNAAAGNLSIQWGLKGPVSATATACATAGNAIIDAYKTIQYDDADMMIAGRLGGGDHEAGDGGVLCAAGAFDAER